MEPKSPSKRKLSITGLKLNQFKTGIKTWVLVSVLFFISLGALLSFGSIRGSYYTVVVDCGSTGTRVSVFEWVPKYPNNGELPILLKSYPDHNDPSQISLSKSSCNYHCFQTQPGLDKFVRNSSAVRDSLEPLITWAERIVPIKRRSLTPILVLATAGLRRLGTEEVTLVLDDIEDVLKGHSFSCDRSFVRVLTGEEEAYYSWVGLNYKMGIFEKGSGSPSLGVIDLGGSSLQFVTEVDSSDEREEARLIRSRLGSVERRVLARSLPAFGLNGAFDRSVVMLSGVGEFELRHPCFGSVFVQNYTCSGCFSLNVSESVRVLGEPNWERCKLLSKAVATNSSGSFGLWSNPGVDYKERFCFDLGGGMLNTSDILRRTLRFHALSGFFAVHQTLNLSPKANMTKIWEKSQTLCTRSWADKSSVSELQYDAAHHCFHAPYMASLIEDALCLGDKEIVFGPADVSWTLGAALIEGQQRSSEITIASAQRLISSPLFVFFLLLCLFSVVYRCQVKFPMLGKKGTVGPRESADSYFYTKQSPS